MPYKRNFEHKEKKTYPASFTDLDEEVESNIDYSDTEIKINPD
jgi:hypothetical protein